MRESLVGWPLGFRLCRGGSCIDQVFGNFAENVFLCFVGELATGQLLANHALAIDERDVRYERWTDHQAKLHECHGGELVRFSHWKGWLELSDELRDVGFGVDRRFQHFEAFGSKLVFEATQNLSGFLAVRSSAENEGHAQHFAAVAGDQRLFPVRKLDGEFGCFAWDVGGESGAQEGQCG
jgi:hypothetical protein